MGLFLSLLLPSPVGNVVTSNLNSWFWKFDLILSQFYIFSLINITIIGETRNFGTKA